MKNFWLSLDPSTAIVLMLLIYGFLIFLVALVASCLLAVFEDLDKDCISKYGKSMLTPVSGAWFTGFVICCYVGLGPLEWRGFAYVGVPGCIGMVFYLVLSLNWGFGSVATLAHFAYVPIVLFRIALRCFKWLLVILAVAVAANRR